MTRLSSMLLAVVMLALMGLARLPLPCVGDGQGHPCSIESCACTAACTCKAACETKAAMDQPSPHHACHMGTMPASEAPPHFALPDAPPPAALVSRVRLPSPQGIAPERPVSAPTVDAPFLPMPEPPPRPLA